MSDHFIPTSNDVVDSFPLVFQPVLGGRRVAVEISSSRLGQNGSAAANGAVFSGHRAAVRSNREMRAGSRFASLVSAPKKDLSIAASKFRESVADSLPRSTLPLLQCSFGHKVLPEWWSFSFGGFYDMYELILVIFISFSVFARFFTCLIFLTEIRIIITSRNFTNRVL